MTIQYQGVWSLQSAAQLQSTQRWVTDPLYKNTTLLLQADDAANGAQNNTFLDSSSNSFAITRNPASGPNAPTQGSFTPFSSQPGAWSNFFSSNAYLSVANNAAFDLSSGAFTIEAWIYFTAQSGTYVNWIAGKRNQSSPFSWSWDFSVNSSGYGRFSNNSSSALTASTIPFNTWTHLAAVCNGSTVQMYVNGVASGSAVAVAITEINTPLTIGNYPVDNPAFNGYISNLRLVKGTAVYTSSFTPSPLPLTAIANTSILTCQSNRFIDNSTANSGSGFAVSISGTPSVQAFSPFAPQFQWTSSVIGGSGYFDGSGDFLQTSSNAALGLSTGDFTVECWYYHMSRAVTNTILAPSTDNLNIYINTSGIIGFYDGTARNSTTTVPLNAWSHIALVRSGSTATLYYNGTSVVSQPNTTNYATASWYIGRNPGGTDQCTGYCTNVRIVKGTAVYTGAFTPPIAPVTTSGPASSYSSTTNVNTTFTSTNTSLLTNFTNAGIYDGTMKNNLETVGNAQISTAVVKYGSGSLAFDGTGDYLSCPAVNAGMNPQNGDFTIECWVWIPALPGAEQALVSTITTGGSGVLLGLAGGGNVNRIQFAIGNLSVSNPTVVDSTTFPVRTWTHVAAVRRAGVLYLYKDGVSIGTPTTAAGSISQATLTVGAWSTGSAAFNGYLDDVRITAGIARYTQNFIPPSVALPRQ